MQGLMNLSEDQCMSKETYIYYNLKVYVIWF